MEFLTKHSTKSLVFIFLSWTVVALFFTMQSYISSLIADRHFSLQSYLVYHFTHFYSWALLTPLLIRFARFTKNKSNHLGKLAVFITLAGVPISILHSAVANYGNLKIRLLLGEETLIDYLEWDAFWMLVATGSFSSYMVYAIVMALIFGIWFYVEQKEASLKTTQLEMQLHQARLQALKGQLQPHFLFNTLNSIASLTDIDPSQARKMISKLSDLLRYSLDRHERQLTTIKDELRFTRKYLEIEKMRLGERLEYQFYLETNPENTVVPFLILQPLVENAIRHGIAPYRKKGTIIIRSEKIGQRLNVTVEDDGHAPEVVDPLLISNGIGLRITQQRLDKLYDGDFEMKLSKNEQGGLTVTVIIPFKEASDNGNQQSNLMDALPVFEEISD